MEQDYDLSIIIENIGSEDMLSADYEITVPSEMNMSGDDFKNILGTVQADGGKITLSYTVSVDSFSDDYKDFKIPILITSVYGDQWDDIVHLRFFRETMSLYIESESNNVQGIVISPDNNSFPFKTNSNSGSIIIPARDCGYLLALSGADYDSETKYALRINDLPEGNGSILISSSVNEPNNTEDNSTIAYMGSDILGYLGVYDLDFYDIRNTEPPIGSPFVTGTSPTTDLTPTWSWTIPTGAVKYRYSFIDGIDWVKTYNNYYTPSLALKTGPYTIFVQAGDASEIWSKSSEFKIRVEADTPSIGSYYDGGYIFYLDGLGGGLMAVECDQGYTNRSTGIELCANLELNGHDDWYLPSKENHRLMYENLYIEEIGDILPECYWSTSTFTSGYYTGYYRFNYGKGYATWDYNYAASSTYWYIRAIREF